jgi:hypothetical protein
MEMGAAILDSLAHCSHRVEIRQAENDSVFCVVLSLPARLFLDYSLENEVSMNYASFNEGIPVMTQPFPKNIF